MTRRSVELATISKSDISELLPNVIAARIEEAADRKMIGKQTMIVNNDLKAVPGQDTIKFTAVAEAPMAQDISPGATFPSADWTVTSHLTVTVSKKGHSVAIQREVLKAGSRDVVQMSLDRLADSLARKADYEVLKNELEVGTVNTDTFTGDGSTKSFTIASGNRPVAFVDSATGTVGGVASTDLEVLTVDPRTGVVTVNKAADSGTTVTIKSYKIGCNYIQCATADKITVSELRQARGKITASRFEPDVLICGEEFYAILVTNLDSLFVDKAKYSAGTELLNFEVGQIMGMKVIITTELNPKLAILKDSDRASVWVDKEGVVIEHKYEQSNQTRSIYASQMYGLGVLQSNAHCAMILQ